MSPGTARAHRQDVQARRQLPVLLRAQDVAQGLAVAVGRNREGHVHDVDPDLGQQPRQLQLLRRRERYPGHLLAVAQRVVVQEDLLGRGELQVPGVGPRHPGQVVQRLLELDHVPPLSPAGPAGIGSGADDTDAAWPGRP